MEVPTNTREHILLQALRLFAKKGYEAIGVAAICEAAGITKPTMYYHFGSKRGLLEALISHWGTE
ncbi:MAG: helix-turn-helix domain containing protein, partial [Sphaerochaeta sp.]|nr:helix-turn-helix domain containing protein [Sphaerochaeta sp.]